MERGSFPFLIVLPWTNRHDTIRNKGPLALIHGSPKGHERQDVLHAGEANLLGRPTSSRHGDGDDDAGVVQCPTAESLEMYFYPTHEAVQCIESVLSDMLQCCH